MNFFLSAGLPAAQQVAILALTLTAAGYDIRYRRIPNWLALAGLLSALVLHFHAAGLTGIGGSLLGLAVAFGVYFAMYALHAVGAGDVKLMGAIGALAGLRIWFVIFLLTSIVGGVLAICLALTKGRFRSTIWNVGYLVRELAAFRSPWLSHEQLDVKNQETLRLPHALSIAVGTALTLLLLHWKG